ncbi:hypothetical protein QEH59_05050 [Coraliomargarita sp. SDUM461004]|uniref:Uncharacterized protein n=1 Tax=Thalassobacterium sedimentorum TaxID=3041258 RepID=A0ABU1AJJ3_9BACT|nr:hypothetical protein [Coraliomargarita sp. SDUM461004]MDQ8193778.1 hypothetical protein [Coraliomargarita sp. SDUM461004]
MKKILLLTFILLSLHAHAAITTLTLDGLGSGHAGKHRHGTGQDTGNDGKYDAVMHHGGGTPLLAVGTQNTAAGEIRRAMIKWALPASIDNVAITSGSQIKSVQLRLHIDFTTQRPPSDLMLGQNYSFSRLVNPSTLDFEKSVVNAFNTGVTPHQATGEVIIDVTHLVKTQYNQGPERHIAAFIFFLENEAEHFADTTALYLIGASGAPTPTTLTIETY